MTIKQPHIAPFASRLTAANFLLKDLGTAIKTPVNPNDTLRIKLQDDMRKYINDTSQVIFDTRELHAALIVENLDCTEHSIRDAIRRNGGVKIPNHLLPLAGENYDALTDKRELWVMQKYQHVISRLVDMLAFGKDADLCFCDSEIAVINTPDE